MLQEAPDRLLPEFFHKDIVAAADERGWEFRLNRVLKS